MKILYINGARVPTERAHGLQIMKMCESFALQTRGTDAEKNSVELWAPRRFNYTKQDPFEYYGMKRSFLIKKVPCIDLIPLTKFLGPLALWITELSFLLLVFCYLSFVKADAIYTRDKFVAFLLSFFVKDIFFETHDVPSGIFFLRFRNLRGIIAITQNLKNEFVKHGISAERILVAPDGVSLNEFDIKETQEECRQKLGLPLDKKIVLYTGHFYPWKGVDVLLKAAYNFQVFKVSNFQNTIFIFVGGTDNDLAKYDTQYAIYNIQNARFIGHRPHKEIPYWLKSADVLILPNSAKYVISKYWTSPMKLFEYMASGRPIVASRLPSLREILNKNNTKFAEADGPESLARAIHWTLDHAEESMRLAARAREDVQMYTWEKRAEKICQFFMKK